MFSLNYYFQFASSIRYFAYVTRNTVSVTWWYLWYYGINCIQYILGVWLTTCSIVCELTFTIIRAWCLFSLANSSSFPHTVLIKTHVNITVSSDVMFEKRGPEFWRDCTTFLYTTMWVILSFWSLISMLHNFLLVFVYRYTCCNARGNFIRNFH
jgi:hypothetical protein